MLRQYDIGIGFKRQMVGLAAKAYSGAAAYLPRLAYKWVRGIELTLVLGNFLPSLELECEVRVQGTSCSTAIFRLIS